jgi:predicted nucleic acid-binding protein
MGCRRISFSVGIESSDIADFTQRERPDRDLFREELLPKFRMIAVENQDFAIAESLFDNDKHALRAGDALHLAIASKNRLRIASNDSQMIKAAVTLEIDFVAPFSA